MSKAQPTAAPATPAQPAHETQPQAGGSYLRQPDGSLLPNPATAAPTQPAPKE